MAIQDLLFHDHALHGSRSIPEGHGTADPGGMPLQVDIWRDGLAQQIHGRPVMKLHRTTEASPAPVSSVSQRIINLHCQLVTLTRPDHGGDIEFLRVVTTIHRGDEFIIQKDAIGIAHFSEGQYDALPGGRQCPESGAIPGLSLVIGIFVRQVPVAGHRHGIPGGICMSGPVPSIGFALLIWIDPEFPRGRQRLSDLTGDGCAAQGPDARHKAGDRHNAGGQGVSHEHTFTLHSTKPVS